MYFIEKKCYIDVIHYISFYTRTLEQALECQPFLSGHWCAKSSEAWMSAVGGTLSRRRVVSTHKMWGLRVKKKDLITSQIYQSGKLRE